MKIDNGFDVPLPPAEAWHVLLDIPRMAKCLPGAQLTEQVDPQTFRGTVAVRLGPVALIFAGTARLTSIDEVARCVAVKASGTEAKGRGGAEATASFVLVDATPGTTHVAVTTDLTLNGSVAQYGRGAAMIASVSQQLIEQFAATLKIELQGDTAARDAAQARAKRGISVFALVFGAFWQAVKRLLTPRPEAGTK